MPSVNKHGKWLFSFCCFNFSPMRTFPLMSAASLAV